MSLSTIVRANTYTNGSVADATKVNENEETAYTAINTIIAAINDASGTKASLDARMDVSLNEDGTLKDSITSGGAWINPGFTYVRVADNSFKIVGANHTDIYTEKRRLRLVLNGTTSYTHVTGSVYSLGDTTVTINDSSITSGLTIDSIEHSSVLSGVTNTNLPFDIEADTLDGQHGSYYRSADNINAGTLGLTYIPATLTGKDADTLDTYHAADLIKGNKNRIINGDFNIMQKSTAGPDLWKGSSTTLSRQGHTLGQTSVPDNPTYYLEVSAATTAVFYTRIENVRTFSSEQCPLSFYACSTNGKRMTVKIKQNFGSGGSTEVEAYSGTVSLTTGWTKFTITDTLDSVSGKTIGAGNYLEVYFTAATTGVTDYIYMSHVQLEKGAFASGFEYRPYKTELDMCQRYFERISLSTPGQRAYQTNGWIQTSTSARYITTFRIPKRVPPTSVAFTSNYYGYPQIASGASTYAGNALPSSFTTTEYDTEYTVNTDSTISQPVGSVARMLAPAAYALYLDISAEL